MQATEERLEPVQQVANGLAKRGDEVIWHGRQATVLELMHNANFADWDLVIQFADDQTEERVRPTKVELADGVAAVEGAEKPKRAPRRRKAAEDAAPPPEATPEPSTEQPAASGGDGEPGRQASASSTNQIPGDPVPPPDAYVVPEASKFVGRRMIDAPDLATIGAELIERYDRFTEHAGLSIWWRWRGKTPVRNMTKPIGFSKRVSVEYQDVIPYTVIIWLAADTARMGEFTKSDVEAAVFHQLCHWEKDDKNNWVRRDHEFSGFGDEVRIFGPWTEELRTAGVSFQQRAKQAGQLELSMDGDEDDDDDADGDDE